MPKAEALPQYGTVWASVYDALYSTRADVEPLLALLAQMTRGRSVLEFGIGTGRVGLALAKAGWQVSGIELSSEMLEVLRAKPDAAGLAVKLGDFTSTRFDKTFDVVLLNFSSLFLLPSQDAQVKAFENAARHLARPDGRFVVDAFVPDHSRWIRGQNVSAADLSASEVDLVVARHERAAQTIFAQHVVISETGIRLQPTLYRYAWPAEMDLMARLAGLELKERWGGYDRRPFNSDSDSHVSVYAPSAE